MSNKSIPLSSDTETRPTEAMRQAMANAEVGDEQQGSDPTVNLLLERVAEMLGQEKAMWLPSGTMCNLIALNVHTRPGEAVITDWMSHIARAEAGGSALTAGVMLEPIRAERGIFSGRQLIRALDRLTAVSLPYGVESSMVAVEQTHNFGGGSVWPLEDLKSIRAICTERGLNLHMDGARLANACVASGVSFAEFGGLTDSVWIDFTKGLGAPMGAVMAGSQAFIGDARRFKQLFGGAMRQAGIAAAACLYALDHNIERLAEDHANARLLAAGLTDIEGIRVVNPEPETNLVFFEIDELRTYPWDFIRALGKKGVSLSVADRKIRAVTHLDVSREDVERALQAIREVVQEVKG